MRKIGVVALVVTGLIVITDAISLIATLGWTLPQLGDPTQRSVAIASILTVIVVIGFYIGFGSYLIRGRDRLASKWFGDEPAPEVDASALLRVGFLLMGVWLIATALPQIINGIGTFATRVIMQRLYDLDVAGSIEQRLQDGLNVVAYTVVLVGAVILIAKSKWFADRLWAAPVPAVEPPECTASCSVCGQPYDPKEYVDMTIARCIKCGSLLNASDA